MRQKVWEIWFIISVVISIALFLVGTLPGSVDTFPDFLYGFIPAIINLVVCVCYGLTSSDK